MARKFLNPKVPYAVLSFKKREAQQGAKRKARSQGTLAMDARHTSMQKVLNVFHILQNIFWRNNLDKCIRKVIRHQYNY